MDPSLPIGPYDPNIPHQRWPLPARPTPSPLESRAHEIAVRTIHTPKPEGSLTVADRITYDKELCLLLDDVHTLCLDILSGKEEETESLHVDLSVIKRKVDKIHQELDKERLANVDDPFVGDEIAERIGIVESDLQDVQQILNFSSRYQELERRIEDWNFLAENTYNPDGEYLQENAYDSLARYVDMQTKLTELENVPRSPEQDQLLQEITQDLKQIRQTFTKVVLPTLKEKLQEAQKNYQQAAKALEKSGLFNRWIRDSHDAILTDFSNFQFALADLRYQKAALEAACSKLPASNKAISKALEHFLAADFIAKKSIETAEKAFIRRIEALPDEKKGLFLKSLPHHSDRAGFAFFLRIYEVISKETSAKDPYFKELASIAQKRSGGNSPNMTTQQMYQTTLEVDYHNKAVISNMNWRQQEDALIKELEKETSVWKKLGLGAFFLLLHAGVAAHGVKKMQGEAAALPSRADRLQQELLSLAGNRAARGAAFIGTMLSDKYEALRTMSEADLQRMTKRFSDDVRQTLEPFRMGAPKPSPDEIFTLHQRYVLQHAKPTLQEQISNWYTQFTTGQAEETVFPESSEAQIAPLQDSLALSSNINLQALLLKAIDNQDLRSVEKLFKTGVDFSSVKLPDSIENKAREILMGLFSRWHSHQNQNERIESEALIIGLLKAIQDPNGKCEGGVPFLHKAVSQRMLGPVKLLLEQGADINSKDEDGNTPLEFAFSVEEPNEEIVMELLKATNEPNGELKDGTPFLLQAVIQDLLGPVKLLLGQGADFNAENDFGQTAIELAFIRGKPNENLIIELIKAGINPNSEIYEKPLLQLAIENNLPEASAALIEHGADINRLDAMGKPPLLYADEQVTIEALLKAGASLTLPNGRSVVDVAIQEKNWDLIITILAIRAPKLTQNAVKSLSKEAPDFILKKLTSHLNWSDYRKIFNPSSFMQLGKLTLLLEALNQGMDINYPDQNGMTALHWAYSLNLPDVAQFLLTRGADHEAVNRFGMQPSALLPTEAMLKQQSEATHHQLAASEFPPSVLAGLQGKAINKGISKTNALHALPLVPTPLNASLLDASIADLAMPTAIGKVESLRLVRDSIPLKTGALRQRLGALTGRYLDELRAQYPVSGIQGFLVPDTIIEPDRTGPIPVPVSITRFVPSSVDMKETTKEGISQDEWTKLLVLDIMLGNTDRHIGNYRVQTTLNERGEPLKRIIPIDHDLTLPDLTTHNEYVWGYLPSVSNLPVSEEWQRFILSIDPDALWTEYEKEAMAYGAAYADYTNGETGINNNVYLNFQARIKVLQDGVRRGWSPNAIGKLFIAIRSWFNVLEDAKRKLFFYNDNPNETLEERKSRIFHNIDNYFATHKSEEQP